MKARRKAHAAERLFFLKPFFDSLKNRHVLAAPENPFAPAIGQPQVLDVVFLARHRNRFLRFLLDLDPARGLLEIRRPVGFFPGEKAVFRSASEVTIGGCWTIDRSFKIEGLNNALGTEIKIVSHNLGDTFL